MYNREDDTNWPTKSVVGKQELEIRVGKTHISFETAKIGSLVDVQSSDDPEGLRVFYYLVQDLRVGYAACSGTCIGLTPISQPDVCLFPYFVALQDQAGEHSTLIVTFDTLTRFCGRLRSLKDNVIPDLP